MKLSKVHLAVVTALTGVGGLASQTASAQQGGLEEIVVTATRRAENLQEVPISIVAITGDSLQMRGLDSLEQVSQGVPNVVITGGGGGTGQTNFRMRGIPNVGTYVDGVWQVGTAGFLTQEFVDIDRVEVLRGPQGTMFGRDSTGGAIRIWTKRPAQDFGGNISVATGSNDRREPVARRLHQELDHGPKRRRHRPAGLPRRRAVGANREAELPLQLSERFQQPRRATCSGCDVPHL